MTFTRACSAGHMRASPLTSPHEEVRYLTFCFIALGVLHWLCGQGNNNFPLMRRWGTNIQRGI